MRIFYTLFFCLFLSHAFGQSLYFPPKTGTAWDTMSPNRLGWCQERIDSLYNFLEVSNSDAFIILKDGKIVLEKYFGTFTADSIHYWASAGKSLTATMIGICQQKGLLNINDSVSKYLGVGWTSETPQKEKLITIKHLLSMTSGLDDTPNLPCTNEDTSRTCLKYKADAGTRWAYHTGPYRKLEEVVSRVAGTGYTLATNNFIGTKTGMSGLWLNGVFFSKPRDMARFGLLALNRGTWQSDTVLADTAYSRAMTNTSQNFNLSYGYLWWLNGKASTMMPGTQIVFPTMLVPNAPTDMFCALGKNDQKIYVVPSKNLVIIRVGDSADENLAISPFDNKLWDYINKLGSGCGLTAVEQKINVQDLMIFPSPANNFISFTGFAGNGPIHYRIANMYGQVVAEDETFNHSVSVTDLATGQYILLLSSDDKQATGRFVKN